MSKFGVLCPGTVGHMNPMCVLSAELMRRGHGVVFFGLQDVAGALTGAGMDFVAIGERDFPEGRHQSFNEELGRSHGLNGVRMVIEWLVAYGEMTFREIPDAIKSIGVSALIVDQVSTSGGTIAEHCGIPFVTICNALPTNREDSVPPFTTNWDYADTALLRLRNRIANQLIERIVQPIFKSTNAQREAWGLNPYKKGDDFDSPLATICQIPAEFDFPRTGVASRFHYVGPLQAPSRREPLSLANVPFPYERLNGKPLIYASLGTLQNQVLNVFHVIASACAELDAQLVISHGNSAAVPNDTAFPGSPIVVGYAPQQQIIDRASLVITHAGLNTTMGAFSSGVPVVAIPITSEQPGIAARIKRTGAGEVLPLSKLNPVRLRAIISQVLTEESYRQQARKMQGAIRSAGGVSRAADIVLQELTDEERFVANA